VTKNKFGSRFNDDDFLAAMPEDQLITSKSISLLVGCSCTTTADRLGQLEEQGKIKKVDVIGGRDVVWQKVNHEKNKEDSEES
jgi:predicted transcriptional regulator